MGIIKTIGYSTDTLEQFVKRLERGEVGVVFDVRREGSGSRYEKRFAWGSTMRAALRSEGFEYHAFPEFANSYGGLKAYASEVKGGIKDGSLAMSYAVLRGACMGIMVDPGAWAPYGSFALMCSCGDVNRCHRRILADLLSNYLGLAVVHL